MYLIVDATLARPGRAGFQRTTLIKYLERVIGIPVVLIDGDTSCVPDLDNIFRDLLGCCGCITRDNWLAILAVALRVPTLLVVTKSPRSVWRKHLADVRTVRRADLFRRSGLPAFLLDQLPPAGRPVKKTRVRRPKRPRVVLVRRYVRKYKRRVTRKRG
jgi:hypothetical protein